MLAGIPELNFPSLEWVAVRPSDAAAPLVLRIEYEGASLERVSARVDERMRQQFSIRVAVEFVSRGKLPRYAHKSAA